MQPLKWRLMASIRPRLIGRGEPPWSGPGSATRKGFNSATADRPWRTGGGYGVKTALAGASIRPRLIGRGERGSTRFPRTDDYASIRPRLIGRGEPRRRAHGGQEIDASIRPRLVGRGEPSN